MIGSSNVQLKDEVEEQIGQYVDIILPSQFYTPNQLHAFLMFAIEESN